MNKFGDRGNFIPVDQSFVDFTTGSKKIVAKNVTLIACPWTFEKTFEFQSQQLGLGYVGAYAKKFGHRIIAFIDPVLEGGKDVKQPLSARNRETIRFGHSDNWIVDRIPQETDVIGINAPFTDSRLTLYPLVRAIKDKYPDMLVVVGGVLATTLPREVIQESGADIVVKGEGEIAFSRILNGDSLESIPGLVVRRRDGTLFENPQRSEQLTKIEQIPDPGYDIRPMKEYVKHSPRGDRADITLSLISSRGCPFNCEFCSIPEKGQLWRPFEPERVLREIKQAIEEWGVNHIEFEDDNFTLKEPRALQILQYLAGLRSKGHHFSCSFPNGIMIDKMTPALAELLVAAGSDIIYLPVESGDTRVLMSMDKPMAEHHLGKTLEVAEFCVRAGLTVSAFFIAAYPGGRLSRRIRRYLQQNNLTEKYRKYLIPEGEDLFMVGEDAEAFATTLKFCKKLRNLGVHAITPLIATPYPGTELYEVCEKFGWLAYPDSSDVLTTVSYAGEITADHLQIETPWCSREEAIERWRLMMDMFPTLHNVRKKDGVEGLLTGKEIRIGP